MGREKKKTLILSFTQLFEKYILFDLKFVKDGFLILVSEKDVFSFLLFFLLFPFIFFFITLMFFLGLLYLFYLVFIFILNYILVKYNLKKLSVITYNFEDFSLEKNSYYILMYNFIVNKPCKTAFYFFYEFLYFLFNFKDFNFSLSKSFFLKFELIFYIGYNIIIRISFFVLFSIPFIIVKSTLYIILKNHFSKNFKYENLNVRIQFVLLNCFFDLMEDGIDLVYKNKIYIYNDKIEFNPILEDFSKIKNLISIIKNLDEYEKTVRLIKLNTYLYNVRHTSTDGSISEQHLTLMVNLPDETIIYNNETSSKNLVFWDKNLQDFSKLELNYLHKSTYNPNLKTMLTPPIQTNIENIKIKNNANEVIQSIRKTEMTKNSMISALLLSCDENFYKTEHIEKIGRSTITNNSENTDLKSFFEKKTQIFPQNKNILNLEYAFKKTDEFVNINKDVFNQIPYENRLYFIEQCLKNHYNIKSDFFKEFVVFYFYKK